MTISARAMTLSVRALTSGSWGFGRGASVGIMLVLIALLLSDPPDLSNATHANSALDQPVGGILGAAQLWIATNLGHSAWLFAVVFTLYSMNLARLKRLLGETPSLSEVVELDQLLDVWIHLFVGIGVIWTAVGMRSALQAALGDPGEALVDTAGSVLQKLVDGGILLALTTTIVGGMGGYLMRLGKTMGVGASLHGFYVTHYAQDLQTLIEVTSRIEARLPSESPANAPASAGDRP